jgi:hypothetical protein
MAWYVQGKPAFRTPNLNEAQDLDLPRTHGVAKIKYSAINQMYVTLGNEVDDSTFRRSGLSPASNPIYSQHLPESQGKPPLYKSRTVLPSVITMLILCRYDSYPGSWSYIISKTTMIFGTIESNLSVQKGG